MDSLIKQMSVRFSNVGGGVKAEEPTRRETQSIKGREKKRAWNWLRRQFTRQMSGEFDPNTQMERSAAVAAAAYAINKSVEESRIPSQSKTSGVPPQPSLSKVKSKKDDESISNVSEQKKIGDGPESSVSRQKSKKEDIPIPITETGTQSKGFSGENATTIFGSPGREVPVTAAKDEKGREKAIGPPPIKKTPTFADELSKKSPDTTKRKGTPSQVTDPGSSSMKKTPTISDEGLNRTSSKKPEGTAPKIDPSQTRPGRTQSKPDIPPPTETIRQSSTRPGTTETQADAWEKAEMDKINERYERLNETIVSWEDRKKKKARRKLDKTESELEKRRMKSLQKFRSDMETINQIAGGARAQAREKRRNEELQAKEKANIIRTTGKVPAATTCFCF